MKVHFYPAFVLLFLPLALMTGCGSDSGQAITGTAVADSQQCISTSCHGGDVKSISPVTGGLIVDEWQRAAHYTKNAAGCRDCHGAAHHTPGSCGVCHGSSSPNATLAYNPDATGQCLKCHNAVNLGSPHFVSTQSFQYVDQQSPTRCRNCHNPHDTTILPEAKAWAESGHGNANALNASAWTETEYRVVGCNGCHDTYSYRNSVRRAGPYTAPYNGNKSPRSFPDVTVSNICIPCHAGRESNDSVAAVTDFTNAAFVNPGPMAAAGLMYMQTGFINFTSLDARLPGTDSSRNKGPLTYGKSLRPNSTGSPIMAGSPVDITPVPGGVVGGVTSAHRRLGTVDIYGRETWTPSTGVFDKGGPCVTCHIKGNVENMPAPDLGTNVDGTYNGNGPYYDAAQGMPARREANGHTVSAVSRDAAQQVCIPCHADEAKLLDPVTAAELKNEESRPFFKAALAVMPKLLLKAPFNIKYDPTVPPYFYDLAKDPAGKTAVTDWTRGTGNQIFGKKVMGACFNLLLLDRDPGAHVHARTYTQRLLFDNIDFLDDGVINWSSAATLIAYDPTTFPDKQDHWVYKAAGARK